MENRLREIFFKIKEILVYCESNSVKRENLMMREGEGNDAQAMP